ncbi:ATP-binding protein [Catenuloplanes sp. NPDC051500]|uniref:ATP-binding protein n=1 Tax=Catenuloplanes sp. NPDC051500 TaxID=3363959 RepID=UPI00379C9733
MSNLNTSLPPEANEVRTWVLHSPDQLRTLRAGLSEEITGEPLAEVPERMLLVATELATNAIRHGRPPTEVRLLRTEDQFVLDVLDRDPNTPPEPVDPSWESAGGRGLQIAQSLSLDVGWYTTPHAKHVWASFPVPATGPFDVD